MAYAVKELGHRNPLKPLNIHMSIFVWMYVYVYIYMANHLSIYLSIYIYIYAVKLLTGPAKFGAFKRH